MSKKHILSELYRNSPSVVGRKATMTEVEEFARWFVEVTCEMIIKLEDGKISIPEAFSVAPLLLGAGGAFKGFKQFDDELRQAEFVDYEHLANTILASMTTPNVPKEFLQRVINFSIEGFQIFKEARTLLGK